MARLPEPGGDSGQWGDILNDYLSVAHTTDGTLKAGSVSEATLQNNAITVAKIATSSSPTSGQSLTYDGTQLAWATNPGSGSVPDANASTKGLVQLAGDLGGTAASPTVPGLASKENTITAGTTAQYYRGDKSWQTLNKTVVGLANVDNTSDASKPVSAAVQAALNDKADIASLSSVATSGAYADLSGKPTLPVAGTTIGTYAAGNDSRITGALQTATYTTKGDVLVATGAGAVARVGVGTDGQVLSADASQASGVKWTSPIAAPVSSVAGKTGAVTLTKADVGLGSVDNTADADKPISTATQTALNTKAAAASLSVVATSGNYNDLSNRPTIPVINDASTSVKGVVQLATAAEVVTGTDTAKAVTAAGVTSAIAAHTYPVIFVDRLSDIPVGTPVDTLVVVRAA